MTELRKHRYDVMSTRQDEARKRKEKEEQRKKKEQDHAVGENR